MTNYSGHGPVFDGGAKLAPVSEKRFFKQPLTDP